MSDEQPAPIEPLVTVGAIAELLGVAPATVRRWCERGDVPAYKLGGTVWRLRRSEVLVWLESQRTA